MSSAAAVAPRTTCLLCGARCEPVFSGLRDRICDTPGEFALRECPACGLAWLDEDPAVEPHGEGYYTHAPDHALLIRQAGLSRLVRETLSVRLGYPGGRSVAARLLSLVPWWRERCESLALFLPAVRSGRLLDVGCGSGIFAARMKSLGWDVTAVEPDEASAGLARSVFGLDVHNGTLDSAALPQASFDAITLSHVIEHVADPIATLKECRRLLKPGGMIVTVTPNLQSLGRRVFGHHWMHWDVPRHRYLFSPRSLGVVVQQAGLRPVYSRTSSRAARWAWRRSRELARREVVNETGSGSSRGPQAIAFQLVESVMASWTDAGEECVLLATVTP